MYLIRNAFIVAVVLIGFTQAQAAVLLLDEFEGSGGAAPDAGIWTVDLAPVALTGDPGGSVQLGDGSLATPVLVSNDLFLYEKLSFSFVTHHSGNAIYEYQDVAGTNEIGFRPDLGIIRVRKDGVNTLEVAYAIPEGVGFSTEIFWSATEVRVLVDGVEKLLLTDPTKIPDSAMRVVLARLSNSGLTQIDSVQVGVPVPEPASVTLVLLGVMSMVMGRRK